MSTLFCHDITVVSRLTEIEMGSHGWPTVNAHLQDQSTRRMRTAQCNYITTTRTQYQITVHYNNDIHYIMAALNWSHAFMIFLIFAAQRSP